MARSRCANSTPTCSPYRSPSKSRTNASTVRRVPWNVGLVPTEIAAGGRAAGVDAVGGDRGERRGPHVGRRIAQRPPPPVPPDDDAVDAVRAAQRAGGGLHVPRGDAGADVGRRDGDLAVVGGVLRQG